MPSFARAFTLASVMAFAIISVGSLGCSRSAQLVNETAPHTKLATYGSAALEVVADALPSDARADLSQELEAQLSDSKLFTRIWAPGSRATADVTLRVTLLRVLREEAVEVAFRVELLEPRRDRALVARFDVKANSKTTGIAGGGGAAYDFEDKTERAIEKAVRAITAHLETYAQ